MKNTKKQTSEIKWSKYIIRDLVFTVSFLAFGLLFSTNHMISISRGLPFRWLFISKTTTHINILRFGVDFLIVFAVVVLLEFIWKFVKANIEANYELNRKAKSLK